MLVAFFGGVLYLLAAIWEAHGVLFLPIWFSFFPLWPLVVLSLCLEVHPHKLGTALCFALVWEKIALPAGLPTFLWLWPLLCVGAFWLLRARLSHRSLWSALLLVFLGRLIWILVQFVYALIFPSAPLFWNPTGLRFLMILLWDLADIQFLRFYQL